MTDEEPDQPTDEPPMPTPAQIAAASQDFLSRGIPSGESQDFHASLRPVLLTNIPQHAEGTMAGLKQEGDLDTYFTHARIQEVPDEEEQGEDGDWDTWFVVVAAEEDVLKCHDLVLSAMKMQFGEKGYESGRMCLDQCGFVIMSGTGPFQRQPPRALVEDLMWRAGRTPPSGEDGVAFHDEGGTVVELEHHEEE